MDLSSPRISFDDRLLAVEESFRQRQYRAGSTDLARLEEQEFQNRPAELGLFLLLQADRLFFEGSYKQAIESGLRSARILADFPHNRRYARVQLILSKAYYALGEMKNAEIRARDSLAAYRRATDDEGQVDAFNQLAGIAYLRCDYAAAAAFLEDALEMVGGDGRKLAQLTGNLGRTRARTGDWDQAELDLKSAIERNSRDKQEMSLAMNLLSLGYLQMRRRQFIMSARSLDSALEIIARLDLKRERVIYAEYAGELAFERGDTYKAKATLSDAYQRGLVLAPNSSLVAQSARRLAEVELSLDNCEEAMKYAQKALELSLQLGERLEIGLARSVIARVFMAQNDLDSATEHMNESLDMLRSVGDPYELGRTLLVYADLLVKHSMPNYQKIRAVLDESHRLFRRLHLEFWKAEANFKGGVIACQGGDLSRGFKLLSRAEKIFATQQAQLRLRAVASFLRSLGDQAVALSVSDENKFKVFGNVITPDEYSDLRSRGMEGILTVLLRKTRGHRALIMVPDSDGPFVAASFSLSPEQTQYFADGFVKLLGQEISRSKPSLLLDTRRDPFINDLFIQMPDPVCSVMVAPFKTSDNETGYLYIDRLAEENRLNPFDQEELNFAVGFADLIAFRWAEIRKDQLEEDNRRLKSQLQEQAAFPNIITQNPELLQVLSQVRQVVDSTIAVTIEGETGSGKDLLARAIHYNSSRREKRFISVNCAALPETLLESELFGYKRGAFTGADGDKAGLFEEADGGTFFLDEIADMPRSIQAKVLRILETQELTRLGDTVPRKVDVRIVSATNKNLQELVEKGEFREDLYYRMAAVSFRLPPLRERREDIPLLAEHFLRDTGKSLSPQTLQALVAYDWPGNVRQLENELKKMSLLSGDADVIEPAALSPKVASKGSSQNPGQMAAVADVEFGDGYSLYDYLSQHEKRFIIKALREKRKVKKHAAAFLGIPESTLRLKIRQYGIDLDALPTD
jgi:transcriptional regulator with GAF, ATPase, and Fis domain